MGLLLPSLAGSVDALAVAGGMGLLLPSFDDPAVAARTAFVFVLDDTEVRFPLFEDVAHPGANSRSAQLIRRQC